MSSKKKLKVQNDPQQRSMSDMFTKSQSKKRRCSLEADESNKKVKDDLGDEDKENNKPIENISDFNPTATDETRHAPSTNDVDVKVSVDSKASVDSKVSVEVTKGKSKPNVNEASEFVFRCKECKQHPNDLKMFSGDIDGAVEEFIALTDPKLSLFNEGEEGTEDDKPQHKLTQFTIYDSKGHIAPLDRGLIERNVELFISGYIKPIYDENPLPEGGISTKMIGPIYEWFTAGFDGGSTPLIGITTAYAEYYLMRETQDYTEFMNPVRGKIHLSKMVIEYLIDNEEDTTYEDLLNFVRTKSAPSFNRSMFYTEDDLLRHAQWLVDMIQSFDSNASDTEDLLITTNCIRSLIKLAGVTLGNRQVVKSKKMPKKKESALGSMMATTTKKISRIFDSIFEGQLDEKLLHKTRARRCGICEACQQSDCGKCSFCMDMVKFGGTGKSKQACSLRRCSNMAVQLADEEDGMNDDLTLEVNNVLPVSLKKQHTFSDNFQHKNATIEWPDEDICVEGKTTYYSSVKINDLELSIGDYVTVKPDDTSIPMYIGLVSYFYVKKHAMVHLQWYLCSNETIMGESGDKHELFQVDDCQDTRLNYVISKAKVFYKKPSDNWFEMGGVDETDPNEYDDNSFFYQKWYNVELARYEDPKITPEIKNDESNTFHCGCCDRLNACKLRKQAVVNAECTSVTFENNTFSLGDTAYFHSDDFGFKATPSENSEKKQNRSMYEDERRYPEAYRKNNYVKGSNFDVPSPYRIAELVKITPSKIEKDGVYEPDSVNIKLRKFYRPENTHIGNTNQSYDLNLLYSSVEEVTLKVSNIRGKCHVINQSSLCGQSPAEYFKGTRDLFYYSDIYDAQNKSFKEAEFITKLGSGKDMGKGGKSKSYSKDVKKEEKKTANDSLPAKMEDIKKLRTLDVFAGCGGLSEGFHQIGLSDSCWAIEKEPSAANAYSINNPTTTVFTDDCNELLDLVMKGEITNSKGQLLPQKGDVELLCGGPPCQGFSGMNRFNSREYSKFKNSLIASYLSYCDYYRPRFFLLENVRNFVSFKRSMVLKLALRALTSIGYQCTFGILQAGSYGVPQTRRRAIILAAAPGEILPQFPYPLHSFSRRGMQLSVVVDERKYFTFENHLECAPLRTISVFDSLSDLPEISNGARIQEISYQGDPITHFQRQIRGDNENAILFDHICKDMSPLVHARMQLIPHYPGADWRDLPNIEMALSDGTFSKLLRYEYKYTKKDSRARAVCACAVPATKGKSDCNPLDRQFHTIIPWCLPHTGNRHNHWAGLYGRLEWEGFFSTTVTNPEPMGKQGRVLHPEQNRVVSVRECARSQGFPDTFRFYGNILDQHRQIGNAVPPPMAKEIGREIKKCVISKM